MSESNGRYKTKWIGVGITEGIQRGWDRATPFGAAEGQEKLAANIQGLCDAIIKECRKSEDDLRFAVIRIETLAEAIQILLEATVENAREVKLRCAAGNFQS